jgi:two-component sensor histidine kinase
MGAGRQLNGQRKDGSIFPIEVGLYPLGTGSERFVLAVVSDRSDRLRAQTLATEHEALGRELGHQEVVAQEMGHRVKNLLATVVALISLSAREAISPKQMEESLRGRIQALSVVLDQASGPAGSAAGGPLSITAILRAVLAPFTWTEGENSRVSLHGPAVVLGQKPAEAMALVFHELMTNALKYGALHDQDGTIDVSWHQADGRLHLCWREEARAFAPVGITHRGFGSTLMTRLIEVEFGGQIVREKTPKGWTTRLDIPCPSLGL